VKFRRTRSQLTSGQGGVLLGRNGDVGDSLSFGESDATVGTDGVGGDVQSLVQDDILVLTRKSLEGDLAVHVGQGGEGGEGEGTVASGARAILDELGGNRVDGGEGDRGIVRP
jgi:hypothetical protein